MRDLNLGKVALYQLSYSRALSSHILWLSQASLSRYSDNFCAVSLLQLCKQTSRLGYAYS